MRGVVHMMAELDILNGFVSKVISDCIDISVNKIKKADKNRKLKNQSIETRIYQITIDALNKFPYNICKKSEKVYDAAECILKEQKKGNSDYKESVRLGLNMISLEVTGDKCEEFLGILQDEICREENRDLAIGHIIHQGERIIEQQQQMDRHMQEGFEESHKNEKEILKEISGVKPLLKDMNGEKGYNTDNKIPIVNRADEYAKKWNKNVFLNDFNEEDENAGVNIKLREIYKEKCLPHYIWKTNTKPSERPLRNLLMDYIIDNQNKKMLLILGQPGIGKSTLITWIMAKLVEKKDDILVYQFANDLGSINWHSENILNDIFRVIDLEYDKLENKILILDGFGEIYACGDRERILNKLDQELKIRNNLKSFSLIITCRENYVDKVKLKEIEYITLQAWDEGQIRNFCENYEEVIISKDSTRISENLEIRINKMIEKEGIMGIPLILYMVLALNVDVERSSSTVDIYDQVFSLRSGGIYDRGYDAEHRINKPEIKEHIHRISQKIAFWMFENNAEEVTISQEKLEEICNREMDKFRGKYKSIKNDVLIGNFFKLKYCEGKGTDELRFVHRSIYEYFVAIYLYESICNLSSKKKIAGKMGELLKRGNLSEQMLEFIKYKFDGLKKNNLSAIAKEVINIMLRDGMTYYVEGRHKNTILWEVNIFANMLEIVGLWNSSLGELDKRIIVYLHCNIYHKLNLKGAKLGVRDPDLNQMLLILMGFRVVDLAGVYLYRADLREADLYEVNLKGSDLREADLRDAVLYKADLEGADLRKADLRKTDLCLADLSRADLREADLRGTNLSRANLKGANLAGADLDSIDLIGADLSATIFDEAQVDVLYPNLGLSLRKSMVLLSEWNEIESFQEYCIRRQEKAKYECQRSFRSIDL